MHPIMRATSAKRWYMLLSRTHELIGFLIVDAAAPCGTCRSIAFFVVRPSDYDISCPKVSSKMICRQIEAISATTPIRASPSDAGTSGWSRNRLYARLVITLLTLLTWNSQIYEYRCVRSNKKQVRRLQAKFWRRNSCYSMPWLATVG